MKDSNQTTITITLPASAAANSVSRSARNTTATGSGQNTPPASVSAFTCYGVTLSAPDIPPDLRLGCSNPSDDPGILVGFIAATATGASVDITVPTGQGRVIQVFGTVSADGTCPDAQPLLNSTDPNRFNNFSSPYLIASTTTDVFQDMSVTLTSDYNPATAVQVFASCSNKTSLLPSLVFTSATSGSTQVAGVPFATEPTVEMEDGSGGLISNYTGSFALEVFGNAACTGSPITETLNATASITNGMTPVSGGIGNFTGFAVNVAGSLYLQASGGGASSPCIPITIVPGAVNPTLSTVAAINGAVVTNTSVNDMIAVQLVDSFGNPVSGKSVSLSSSGSVNTFISTLLSNASGIALFNVGSSTAQSYVSFYATDTSDALSLSGAPTVTFNSTAGTSLPSSLMYSPTSVTYTAGTTISNYMPSSSGGTITTYFILPALPPGLIFNSTTGVISGNPTAISPSQVYTVYGSNGAGTTTTSLTLAVN